MTKKRSMPTQIKIQEEINYNRPLILESLKEVIELLATEQYQVNTANSILEGFARHVRIKEMSDLDKLPNKILDMMLRIATSYLKRDVAAKLKVNINSDGGL